MPVNKNIKKKLISFNTDFDGDLFEYANSMPNFTAWVKRKLTEEIIINKEKRNEEY